LRSYTEVNRIVEFKQFDYLLFAESKDPGRLFQSCCRSRDKIWSMNRMSTTVTTICLPWRI